MKVSLALDTYLDSIMIKVIIGWVLQKKRDDLATPENFSPCYPSLP
jgi:hypothetical protein